MLETLDRQRLEELLTRLTDTVEGDWLLVGGALVALWLEPRRVTEDVDLVGLAGGEDERFRLMEFAEAAGLPIEAVNTAADFFVRRVDGWRDEIEIFRAGRRGRIYRPTPTLFLLLKMRRLSERDLADCLAMIREAHAQSLPLASERILSALAALPSDVEPAVLRNRTRLARALREAHVS